MQLFCMCFRLYKISIYNVVGLSDAIAISFRHIRLIVVFRVITYHIVYECSLLLLEVLLCHVTCFVVSLR